MKSLYYRLKAAGITTDHHESDLYVKATPQALEIIRRYEYEIDRGVGAVSFIDNITHTRWLDIPFMYTPWWEKRQIKNNPLLSKGSKVHIRYLGDTYSGIIRKIHISDDGRVAYMVNVGKGKDYYEYWISENDIVRVIKNNPLTIIPIRKRVHVYYMGHVYSGNVTKFDGRDYRVKINPRGAYWYLWATDWGTKHNGKHLLIGVS